MAGATGEASIVDKFCKVYEELYNSCGSSDVMASLKEELSMEINRNQDEASMREV